MARGDLTQSMALEAQGRALKGEFLRTARTVNTMVEQFNGFASEVTRVAREVGTEGKLGGQARVKGLSGTWKDLSDNVNLIAANLTDQVRNIATVTMAVASGDLSKKSTVDARGELLGLKDTVNTMVDQLRSFTSEVTRVSREVGTDGKLGGQVKAVRSAALAQGDADDFRLMAQHRRQKFADRLAHRLHSSFLPAPQRARVFSRRSTRAICRAAVAGITSQGGIGSRRCAAPRSCRAAGSRSARSRG